MHVWRMRIARRLTKATNTHTQYVIVIAFSLQQWWQERASVLRCYAHCLSCFIYTGCPRMNGQNFGRVFLMFKYTDVTQDTYVQS